MSGLLNDSRFRDPARLRMLLALLALLLTAAPAEAKWRTYEDCRPIANDFNDGDSFHVRVKRRHYIFRLYYVDTPESDTTLTNRIAEQAAYWEIDEDRIPALAKDAAEFTKKFLKDGFTVYTERIDARGRSQRKRYFAMVKAGDTYLSEALVGAGLARIYGIMGDLPDGTRENKYLARLRAAEREAKRHRRGAWAAPSRTRTPSGMKRLALPEVEPQTVTLDKPLTLYSLKTSRLAGSLPAGARVQVLGMEAPGMLRIRFKRDDKTYEAKCRRAELGL